MRSAGVGARSIGAASMPARSASWWTASMKSRPRAGRPSLSVGRPEDRALAVDQEAAGCVAVADDAVGADAELRAGVVLVGGVPAARVAVPAELGERLVEPLIERGEDLALVEVGDAGPVGGSHDDRPPGRSSVPGWEVGRRGDARPATSSTWSMPVDAASASKLVAVPPREAPRTLCSSCRRSAAGASSHTDRTRARPRASTAGVQRPSRWPPFAGLFGSRGRLCPPVPARGAGW